MAFAPLTHPEETVMKYQSLLLIFGVLLATPSFAADVCREDAKAAGYEGSMEMLEPCKPKPSAAVEQFHVERIEREGVAQAAKPEAQPIAQVETQSER